MWDHGHELHFTPVSLLVLLAGAIAACGPAAGLPAESGSSALPSDTIPLSGLPPRVQCLLDHGFRLVTIVPPQIEGDPPEYRTEDDYGAEEGMAIMVECSEKYPQPEKTDAEVRVIYDRWVKERECLVGLGYDPVEPPTFEKFMADWRSTGPWMPIDGIDTNAWSGAEYEAAKKACTLEFFSRS